MQQVIDTTSQKPYTISKTIKNGIEHITYTPHHKKHDTPILMQHGMWHGAWCWWLWQELFAEWGWESTSISLPGHGESPLQRPLQFATLSYYLQFLHEAIEGMPQKPILMGHSMGGALTQWYLKYHGDLPAAILVAPWVSHNSMKESMFKLMRQDTPGILMGLLTLNASHWVRNPKVTGKKLISKGAVLSADELYHKLGDESVVAGWQHNFPFWSPAKIVNTPMLWLAAECDTLIGVDSQERSAAHYGADFQIIPDAAHNLMMEHNFQQTAKDIYDWLIEKGIQ